MATNIDGVKILDTDVFTDHRGDLWTTWKKDEFPYDINFNHDKVSSSRKRVLRGIHGDYKSWKLVTCVCGEIYQVVVDCRKESNTFEQYISFVIGDKNNKSILIPPRLGNAYYVISRSAVYHYKLAYHGKYNDIENQFTYKWNDKRFKIDWPTNNPILSNRDK